MKTTKPHKIKSMLNLERYNMDDFWSACPHDVDIIKSKTRKEDIRSWRQVGMVWARLCGLSLEDAGLMLGRDHATVVHSENMFIDVLEGFGDPLIRVAIKEVQEHIREYIPKNQDMNVNEASCLVVLDHIVGSRIVDSENAKKEFENYIKNK